MFLIIKNILNSFSYPEYIKLVKMCPYLIKFYCYQKEYKYYNNHNLYQINDTLPMNLIYNENFYFFFKLMNPIYFYFENFEIINNKNNYLILKSNNNNYISFFLRLQEIILQSFKKNYYIFDTSIIINQNEIIIYIIINDFQIINLDYNSSKFLIKYTGVKLQNNTKMINNFVLVKSF